jgi:thiamine-phosphate pyrophosphorylase
MKLIVISPEQDDPRETAVLGALLASGLERYHVRKPHWPVARLEAWLRALPTEWYSRLVLHQHHELVAKFGLGGRHWRDEKGGRDVPDEPQRGGAACPQDALSALGLLRQGYGGQGATRSTFTSRSCHDFAALGTALGKYDSVFFGPVFPSISKPGHGLGDNFSANELSALLAQRTPVERHTHVLALGGITVERLPQVHALGFDGVGVLGAIWQSDDPVTAFLELQSTALCLTGGARCPLASVASAKEAQRAKNVLRASRSTLRVLPCSTHAA